VGEIAFGGEIALRAVKSGSTPDGWISFHQRRRPLISPFAAWQKISPERRLSDFPACHKKPAETSVIVSCFSR